MNHRPAQTLPVPYRIERKVEVAEIRGAGLEKGTEGADNGFVDEKEGETIVLTLKYVAKVIVFQIVWKLIDIGR